MNIIHKPKLDHPDTPGLKSGGKSDRIYGLFCGRHNPGKRRDPGIRVERRLPSKIMGPMKLVAGVLMLGAFAAPVQAAVVPPPGTRVQLTWTSLGSGTRYYVQTSTNLLTWAAATNTAATNVSLSFNGNTLRAFRLWASNAPPQSVTLAWNASVPATGVTGYYIYYGRTTGNYTNRIDAGLASNGVVNNLLVGATYYFVTTAYTASGMESRYSNVAVWQSPLRLKIQRLP
jgi:hypothetical protein